jgi:hypothetical protein
MAIFKPEMKETKSTGFLGPIEVGIVGFTDRSSDFDWSDIFIEVELSVKDSEYTNRMSILGQLDKDATGKISGGHVLKRMYKFFDAIGCTAGINLDGKWEDNDNKEIKDIATFLNERFTTSSEKYVAYAYKKKPKPGKKVYTEVYPRLYPNTDSGKNQCLSDVAWLKGKGIIREADANDMPQQSSAPLADSALNNL